MLQTTVEGSRPFASFTETVQIPGASELTVNFDETTLLTTADDVWVSEDGSKANARVFNNLRGSAGGRSGAGDDSLPKVSLGDVVVRGPDWTADEHGDADGGAGGKGTVVAVTEYMTVHNRGVSVAWQTGITNLYRWGHEGRFDVKVFQSSSSGASGSSDGGVVVQGEKVVIGASSSVEVAGAEPTAESKTEEAVHDMSDFLFNVPVVRDVSSTSAALSWPNVVATAGERYEVGISRSSPDPSDMEIIGTVPASVAFIANLQVGPVWRLV